MEEITNNSELNNTLARLMSVYSNTWPCGTGALTTAEWVANAISKGLTKALVINTTHCIGAESQKAAIVEIARRAEPSEVLSLTKALETGNFREVFHDNSMGKLFTAALYLRVDETLLQIESAAKGHAQCVRSGHELIILFDQDARFEWLYDGAKYRLKEQLSTIGCDPQAALMQEVDFTRHSKISIRGHEIIKTRWSGPRVNSKQKRLWATRKHLTISHYLSNYHIQVSAYSNKGFQHIASAASLHKPCSRVTRLLSKVCRNLQSIKISTSRLVEVAGIIRENACKSPANAFATIFRISGTVITLIAAWISYGLMTGETAAHNMPKGFRHGQINKAWPSSHRIIRYGMYVPPHLKDQPGPFPLIVFLHGLRRIDEGPNTVFFNGLPKSVAGRFGEGRKNGRLDALVFCPIDPNMEWNEDSSDVHEAMEALNYVVSRHNIDQNRVYLTGISSGANGVWRLAELYPDKWAAVAPVCPFITPVINKVSHIPAYIVHGEKDKQSPVEKQRSLVSRLKALGTEVHYEEISNKGHFIASQAYDHRPLYDWLLARKRKNPQDKPALR